MPLFKIIKVHYLALCLDGVMNPEDTSIIPHPAIKAPDLNDCSVTE